MTAQNVMTLDRYKKIRERKEPMWVLLPAEWSGFLSIGLLSRLTEAGLVRKATAAERGTLAHACRRKPDKKEAADGE